MDLRETGAQEGQVHCNIYDICMIISEAHPFCKKQPSKTPKQNKEKQILYFNIMSSIAETTLFTKHILQF